MAVLIHEKFEGNWQDSWTGKSWNAYPTSTRHEGESGLRILFRKGSHYGVDLRQAVPGSRHVRMSYWLRVATNWNSNSTGKLPGFADLRWTDSKGRTLSHGNRRPSPDGFSFRLWFGKTKQGQLPLGMYVYHAGQKRPWGDSIPCGEIPVGKNHILVEVESNLDTGYVKCRLDVEEWVSTSIQVGAATEVTTAWLNGYWGGWRKAPGNMAADIDEYRLDDLSAPSEPIPVADQLRNLAATVEVMETALESIGANP